ncbi:MAG: nif-specific transcriptional activator NifA [Deltaproteobacteria bacterium]|nr:nif-specific transcriptional activator NifA [Deltaproteobacteria bacterium]
MKTERGRTHSGPDGSRKVLELTTLYEISKLVSTTFDLDRVAAATLKLLSDFLGLNRGTLTLLDGETGRLVIRAAYGMTRDEMEKGNYRIGEGVTGKVVKTGVPMIVPKIGAEPMFLDRTGSRSRLNQDEISFLSVPIKLDGKVIGVLSVDHLFSHSASFDREIRFLTIVAGTFAQAVRIQRMVEAEKAALKEENRSLRTQLAGRYRFENIIGESDRMQEVFEAVGQVSRSNATVMLRGESGTGKELIARAIHYNSLRSGGPFVKLNCAALPETLLETELFGHEKGAFTGAERQRPGRFELASGGTLFLDEIGEVPPSFQVKLLRVLQEREFERVGGTETLAVDVRIIVATNRDLEKAVSEGKFREDLYYRLNVIPIFLPSLRERREDLPLLIEHFLRRFNEENGKDVSIPPAIMRVLMEHPWPGNVRALENYIERMVVMARGNEARLEDLPAYVREGISFASPEAPGKGRKEDGENLSILEEMERRRLLATLKEAGWVQARAARVLGITPRQVGYKIKKYGISPREQS